MRRVRDAAGSPASETDGVRLGAPASQLRCPVGRRRAFLVHRRAAVVTVLALAAALVVVAVSVLFGAYNISGADALHTLLTGSGSRMDRFFVLTSGFRARSRRRWWGRCWRCRVRSSRACHEIPWAAPTLWGSRPAPPVVGCSCFCWRRRRVISRSRWGRSSEGLRPRWWWLLCRGAVAWAAIT